MLTSCVVLLHDNAACTRALLEHFNWELFDHPPCSPHLAPSEYHMFIHLKKWLRSQRFNNNEELKESVKTWLSSQAVDLFDTGIQKLIPRYDKCLDLLTPHWKLLPNSSHILHKIQYCEHALTLRLHAFICSVHYKNSAAYE
jgi:hypothetical protein